MSQSRKQKIRGDLKKQRRRRVVITTVVVAVLMIAVVVGIILLNQSPSTPSGTLGTLGSPISQTLYGQLSGVSDSTLATVGAGQGITHLQSISGPPLTSGGKPEFLYVGGDFCPYCAAERWSIIVALSKFGSFGGLEYMLSSDSPGEINPNTSTFTFLHLSYTSQYVAFVSVEEYDRNHAVQQTPTSQEASLVQQYDTSQGIPFIDIYNQYSNNGAGSQYSPNVLSGLNWTQIGSQLNSPSSSVAQGIDGAANALITAMCKVDGGNPTGVCSQSYANLSPPFSPFTGQPALTGPLDYFAATDQLGVPRNGKTF